MWPSSPTSAWILSLYSIILWLFLSQANTRHNRRWVWVMCEGVWLVRVCNVCRCVYCDTRRECEQGSLHEGLVDTVQSETNDKRSCDHHCFRGNRASDVITFDHTYCWLWSTQCDNKVSTLPTNPTPSHISHHHRLSEQCPDMFTSSPILWYPVVFTLSLYTLIKVCRKCVCVECVRVECVCVECVCVECVCVECVRVRAL